MIKEIKGEDFRKMQLTELDMLVEFDKVCRKYNMLLMRATHSGILPSTYARTLPRFPEKSGSIVLSTHGTKAASTIHTTFASIASNAERPTCAKSF